MSVVPEDFRSDEDRRTSLLQRMAPEQVDDSIGEWTCVPVKKYFQKVIQHIFACKYFITMALPVLRRG